MARDYKHRAQTRRQTNNPAPTVAWWKWVLVLLIIGLFVWFLFFLRTSTPANNKEITQALTKPVREKSKIKQPQKKTVQPAKPRFEFYTILPETEVVVPEYEIKTRKREERVGKARSAQYVLQAGSFRDYKQADKLKARLALMGIESRIEKARVGNKTWNRIKMGPFANLSNVDNLRNKLKQNNVDVVVMEVGK